MAGSFFSTYVTGDKAVDRKLEKLKENVRKKIVRAAMGKAGTALRKTIAQAAPVGKTRTLKKSIGKSLKKKRGRNGGPDFQGLRVGANVGKKKINKDGLPSGSNAYHAHLVILGTKERFNKAGKSLGKMRKNDFIKRASRGGLRKASVILRKEILKRIDKEAGK